MNSPLIHSSLENISPVSVLLSLHGGGDNAESNMQYSGFKEQADNELVIEHVKAVQY